MDYEKLAELLFPQIDKEPAYWVAKYPARTLPEGAKVTRLAPSPTGFIHLGNLYGAFTGERLAHQSNGVFFLRIEDTDDKREVEGAVEAVIDSLDYFRVHFDEGALELPGASADFAASSDADKAASGAGTSDGENTADSCSAAPANTSGKNVKAGDRGAYGPYYQSDRAEIYQTFAKQLVREGKAYPCFCTAEELDALREKQEAVKANPGYHTKWAKCRSLSYEEIEAKIKAGTPFTLRYKSRGIDVSAPENAGMTDEEKAAHSFSVRDGIRGKLTMPENYQDVVLLKQNGIPTYHFAHVIDDHLMGTTHVVRGEEWLSSLPIHVQLFDALGWQPPVFCHTTVLMKMDGDTKRKLSKRKDPELGLKYYKQEGYHPDAVREYLLIILNSNYEEWRIKNPDASWEEFRFRTEKMSSSGTLFDLNKLNDVSKDVLVKKSAEELYQFLLDWSAEYGRTYDPTIRDYGDGAPAAETAGAAVPTSGAAPAASASGTAPAASASGAAPAASASGAVDLHDVFAACPEKMLRILSIDRTGDKPRKDLVFAKQIVEYFSYFFDETYLPQDDFPEEVPAEDVPKILSAYVDSYDPADDNSVWFGKVRDIAESLGYAGKPKDFKNNPDQYKGHVGHVSTVIRVAVMGRRNSPDLWTIQQILGKETVLARIGKCL